jgi:hypothetical protein
VASLKVTCFPEEALFAALMVQQWRDADEADLEGFPTGCRDNKDLSSKFLASTLIPTPHAIEQYKRLAQTGRFSMVDEQESEVSSFNTDYDSMMDQRPTKKPHSVNSGLRKLHISDESPTKPKRHDVVLRRELLPNVASSSTSSLQRKPNASLQLHSQPPLTPTRQQSWRERLRNAGSKSSLSPTSQPKASFQFDFESEPKRTPTRQQSWMDKSVTSSPHLRTHQTGRKYIFARSFDNQHLCCWISFNVSQLQAAHLVPRFLEQYTYGECLEHLRQAIGGKFSVNSRLNYLIRK